MLKRTKLLAPAVLATFVLVAGCGNAAPASSTNGTNTGNSTSSGGSSSAQTVTLRFAWWGNQSRADITQKAINLFEKEHPDIKIQPEFTGYSSYFQKMDAEAAGGNLPDVMQQNYGAYLTQYAQQGLLMDLTPYTKDGTIDTSKIDPSLLNTGEQNGKLVGIVNGENALAVLYNPDLLKQAGLSNPANDWTWTDFENMAETVHQKLGIYGARTLDPTFMPEYFIRQNGSHLFNQAQDGLGYTDDSLLANYWKINLKLIGEGAAPTQAQVSQIQGLEQEPLSNSKAAFDIRWSNQVDAMSNGGKVNLALAPLPGPGQTQGMYLKPSMFFSITKDSKHPKEAAEFINFLENDPDCAKILGTDRGIPVNSDIRASLKSTLPALDQATFDYIDYVQQHSSPIDQDSPKNSAQILQALKDVDQKVEYKQETPEQGAADFRKQATALLK